MCRLDRFVILKGLPASATRKPQIVDMDSFAAASLRSEYKPELEFRKMLFQSHRRVNESGVPSAF